MEAVTKWIAAWIRANDPWKRKWRGAEGNVVQVETLRYNDSFTALPKCGSAATSGVAIELTGRSQSAYWKDWMVRMIEGAESDLGLRFVRAVDVE
jgi:hypothetical protein